MTQDLVLVGVVGKPHGVRGLVHVHSYVEDPISLETYGPLQDEQGRFGLYVGLKKGVLQN